jgi:NitT/TauT family transport system permease protein
MATDATATAAAAAATDPAATDPATTDPAATAPAARSTAEAEADRTISGLDALELGPRRARRAPRRVWSALWPKLVAVGLVLAGWQLLYVLEWKDPWVLPSPAEVGADLGAQVGTGRFWEAIANTMQRALLGFGVATLIGAVLGVAVARVPVLRAALGSMITALQTMPSIAWFPLAILLFGITESAIMFVIVLGAAPSIANGVIAGVDYVPPLLLRAGRNIGARGARLYAYVIAPASLPHIVAGLKQGWAFAWRSLMAGELLVIIAEKPAIGTSLELSRQLNDSVAVIGGMVVILVLGLAVDAVFARADRAVRERWGLVTDAR